MFNIKRVFFIFLLGSFSLTKSNDLNITKINFDDLLEDVPSEIVPEDATRKVDPEDIITIINSVGLQDILFLENLYLKTYPLKQRNLFDLPVFLLRKYNFNKWTIGADIFLQDMERIKFTENSEWINSYIDLENPNIMQKIQEYKDVLGSSVPQVLSLFSCMKARQRAAGIMLNFERKFKSFCFGLRTPLYYAERNYYVTPAEKKRIEDAQLYDSDADFTDLIKEHLVSDKLGIGDIRLKFGGFPVNKKHLLVSLGLELTIPSSIAFAKGLYGTYFKVNNIRPKFDLSEVFTKEEGLFVADTVAIENFLMGTIDKLSSNILDYKLGQKHFSIQGYLEPIIEGSEKFSLKNRFMLAYFFPATEQRFYMPVKDPAKLEKYNDLDGNYDAQLKMVNTELINTLYSFVYDSLVAPGAMLQLTNSISLHAKHLELDLGIDTWWQGKEKIKKVNICDCPNAIKTYAAERPYAYQSKFFGHLQFHTNVEQKDWILSLNFDTTFLSSGIGKDFTLTMGIECSF